MIMVIHNPLIAQAKLISGVIVNAANNISLGNSTVNNITKGKFVFADSTGTFSIQASEGDTLIITHVGFNSNVEIVDFNNKIFYLSENIKELPSVIVNTNPTKFREINIGYNQTKYDTRIDLQKNYRTGALIVNDQSTIGMVKTIIFNIKSKGSCNQGVKLLIIKPDTNDIRKSTLLLAAPIFIPDFKLRRITKINVENLKIPFDKEGLLISLETYGGEEICDPEKTILIKATQHIFREVRLIGYGNNKWNTMGFKKYGHVNTPQIGIIVLTPN